MPDWVEHAIWWQVYPLGFTGAPARSGEEAVVRRLGRLEGWLDYAVELGVSGLALGPVFASHTRGYDTIDHYRIDKRLGDEDDFARLRGAAHRRGLRILLDGVFNHVGRGFPAFTDGPRAGADRADSLVVPPDLARRSPAGNRARVLHLRRAPAACRPQP